MMANCVLERLGRLRAAMAREGMAAYLVTDSAPHAVEHSAAHWKERSWMSGFTGSSGILAVTAREAALWTDARYYAQDAAQLEGSSIEMLKMGAPGVPGHGEWILARVAPGGRVGLDGRVFFARDCEALERIFAAKSLALATERDLVGEVWGAERPALPNAPIFTHEPRFAGAPSREKISAARAEMRRDGADYALIAGLEDVAWLMNIRGGDVHNLPVAYAHALLSETEAELYIQPGRVPDAAAEALRGEGVAVRGADELAGRLGGLRAGARVCYDPAKLSERMLKSVGRQARPVPSGEPTLRLKAVKNAVEIQNLRECQIRDGLLMVRLLRWIEEMLGQPSGSGRAGASGQPEAPGPAGHLESDLREGDIAKKVRELRAQTLYSVGESFDSIVGYGPNGALMYYTPDASGGARIENSGLLVVDCGGQYFDGTTDITRTIALGEPTQEERRDFTLALKAHIALASARFLYGSAGCHVDVIARKVMWDEGLDYKSGTGHGVGYFLGVHEGPQSISMMPRNEARLEENMLVSIEPGVYREGRHGVRIENMARIRADSENGFGRFMGFEILSWCPICLNGVDPGMLDGREKDWLNGYHRAVFQKLSPFLDEEETRWLAARTSAL
jgi:Xaa-Pro aminopeptidase